MSAHLNSKGLFDSKNKFDLRKKFGSKDNFGLVGLPLPLRAVAGIA